MIIITRDLFIDEENLKDSAGFMALQRPSQYGSVSQVVIGTNGKIYLHTIAVLQVKVIH